MSASGDPIVSATTATYISATSFSVTGDQTSVLNAGRRIRACLGSTTRVHGTIVSATYTTLTTVVLSMDGSDELTSALTGVWMSTMDSEAGSSSLVKHDHSNDEAGGSFDRLSINSTSEIGTCFIGGDGTTGELHLDHADGMANGSQLMLKCFEGLNHFSANLYYSGGWKYLRDGSAVTINMYSDDGGTTDGRINFYSFAAGSAGDSISSPILMLELDRTDGAIFPANVEADSYSVGGTDGASGSFTTVDGKTVTVVNGLITNIAS